VKKEVRLLVLIDGAVAAFLLAAPYLASWMMAHLPSCPFAEAGVLCPACGGTRCVASLMSGEVGNAFSHHPYFLLLFVYLAVLLFVYHVGVLFRVTFAKKIAVFMADYRMVIAWAVAFAIFGLLRNFL